jgi:hypothetical protein
VPEKGTREGTPAGTREGKHEALPLVFERQYIFHIFDGSAGYLTRLADQGYGGVN